MKLLIGLGNPGPTYAKNRHNVGFQFTEFVENQPEIKPHIIKTETHFNAEITKLENLIIARPQEYMNKSGNAVQKLMQFYKLLPEDTYIAHDDLDIAVGKYKIIKRGPQIHNGLSSIDSKIGVDYWKIRIGIENRDPQNRLPGEAYVLQNFTTEENAVVQTAFSAIFSQLKPILL
jgi:PTH1 family peptidyl-tRNA hydrolase